MTITQEQAADWVRRRAHIRVHSGAFGCESQVMAEGRVIAWCAAPSFTIEHPDGTRSSWSAALPIAEIETPAPVDSQPGEPENGSYVAVEMPRAVWVYRRDDARAAAEEMPESRWWLASNLDVERDDGSPRTWAELCRWPVAYVGVFVERGDKEETDVPL